MMQVRSALILKITPASDRDISVITASLMAASLDEIFAEVRCPASVAHEHEQCGKVYLADEDGTFTVDISNPEYEDKVTTFITACGFTVAERYDAGWQTADEMRADAAADAILAAAGGRGRLPVFVSQFEPEPQNPYSSMSAALERSSQ